MGAIEARSKIFIQATACDGHDVILTYRTSIYVKCSNLFKNLIMTTFFSLISSINGLYYKKKERGWWWRRGGSGSRSRAVWGREGRKWVVARGELG